MTTIQQAAQAMGRVKSPAKTQAARENGKKGGRPRKPGTREDRHTGQYVPTVDGIDQSPTSFDETRALQIATDIANRG